MRIGTGMRMRMSRMMVIDADDVDDVDDDDDEGESEFDSQDEVSVCKRVCVPECFCLCVKASV